jgi:hypothetical protein
MFTLSSKRTRKEAGKATARIHVVEPESAPRPRTPGKHKFIGREHRKAIFDVWRNRMATITTLCQRNEGLGRNDIEGAILDELDERERRQARMEMQRDLLLAHCGPDGTGPLAGPAAVRPSHFGGLMAFGRKAA